MLWVRSRLPVLRSNLSQTGGQRKGTAILAIPKNFTAIGRAFTEIRSSKVHPKTRLVILLFLNLAILTFPRVHRPNGSRYREIIVQNTYPKLGPRNRLERRLTHFDALSNLRLPQLSLFALDRCEISQKCVRGT
jgi:hypothetical protein